MDVVILGCHVSGLGVIRALAGRARLIGVSYDEDDPGFVSRYLDERHRAPHPSRHRDDYISFLLDHADAWEGAVLIDTDDDTAMAVAQNRKRLAARYRVATPEWAVLRQFILKEEAWTLAAKCGVPHPTTIILPPGEQPSEYLDYPCILKPSQGHAFKSVFGRKNFKIESDDALNEKLALCAKHGLTMMLQEIIPGPDTSIEKCMVYIDRNGQRRAAFFYNKLRQNPPQFGIARVAISTEVNPEVEDLSTRLLSAARYRGICTVEFRRDARDGALKLMEVNTRMPRMNWLATYAGINFPWILCQDQMEQAPVPQPEYRVPAYWIEAYADWYHSCRHRNRENFTLREYIAPYLARHHSFAVLSVRDPRPFLLQGRSYVRRALSRSTRQSE
jgi:predicted ATP-grasp superfamily ATP-dependent carboligase